MKAQVLHKYDPEMKADVWVTGEELPNPKIEKASDVIVKIGAAGVCRTDLHIIEDEALIDALERRKVYAVGLDVYKNEPNLNPGYLKHKSAFILPHLGSATKETRTAMANLAIDNMDEFFKTGGCKNKVN